MLNKSAANNSFSFQPQSQQSKSLHDENYYIQQLQNQYQRQQGKTEYIDPLEAKYEKEMGTELQKPLSSTYQDLISYLTSHY